MNRNKIIYLSVAPNYALVINTASGHITVFLASDDV